MDKYDIIERISYARNRANLSARALSQRIGMNDGYINRLESQKNFLPSVEVLLRIIEVCELTEEEFFYHDISSYKQDMELIKDFKHISPAQKDAILILLRK